MNNRVSKEENLEEHHTISPNGYDVGRDELVASALNNGGTTSHDDVTYKATTQNITGLLTPGTNGINHGKRLLCIGIVVKRLIGAIDIAIDGVVVLLTISIVS
jgi:hypothetical protein